MSEGLWDLRHNAAALEHAAATWSGASQALASTADDVNAAASSVLGAGWAGVSADSYDAHRHGLVADVDAGSALAEQAAGLLLAAAGSVRAAQAGLDSSFATLAAVERSGSGDALELRPADEVERLLVESAIGTAEAIRVDLDATLGGDLVRLDDLANRWRALAERWTDAAAGAPSFDTPGESDEVGVLVVDGVAVINTGGGADEVKVSVDATTGEVVVHVNDVIHRFPPGTPVELRTGEGDDSVTGYGSHEAGLTVLAGAGDDEVDTGPGSDVVVGGTGGDELAGGDGRDQLFGNDGQDYLDGQAGGDLVVGGQGSDTVYGLGGRDTLAGGEGEDYLEGGEGGDDLVGGAGDDVVSGGAGGDTLSGGDGQDVLYAGLGADDVDGGSGTDTSYTQEDDRTSSTVDHTVEVSDIDLGQYVDIQGSEEFQARIRADLALLASSPNGQEILAGIVGGFDENDPDATVVIREREDGDPQHAFVVPGQEGYDYVLGIEPEHDDLRGYTPPSVVLGHELAHVYDHAQDHRDDLGGETGDVSNSELAATGLPVDHDGDPETDPVIDPEHPIEATENGLRDELGLPIRDSYVG